MPDTSGGAALKDKVMRKFRSNGAKAAVATGAGAGVGGWVGAGVGVAAFGGAVSGALPLAVIGGGVALLATKTIQYRREARDAKANEKLARSAHGKIDE